MTRKYFPLIVLMTALLILISFVASGLSQGSYPDRPITIVVGIGAGGFTDLAARAISKAAEKELGQSIIVENKAGAGGVIGVAFVAKSKPDGYTLGVTGTGQLLEVPNMRQTPYDPLTDFTDIMAFAKFSVGLAVKADAPWSTFEELITYVKGNPGKFTYSTAGIGLPQHICMERLAKKEGMKWVNIPFKSGAEAVTATLGDHTNAVAQSGPDLFPHLKAGKLKMLLVLSDSRFPDFPNVPTILEKGYGFSTFAHIGVYGPKGLPEPIRQKLETGFKNAMKAPSFIEAMMQLGVETIFMSGSEYSAKWKSRYHELGKILMDLGLVEK